MTVAEMAHFHSKRVDVAQLCEHLGGVVRSYARNGIRKPRDVSDRLNADRHKTAAGSAWTPRLTFFLLGLIFLDASQIQRNAVAWARAKKRNVRALAKGKVTRPRSIFLSPALAIYRQGAQSLPPLGPIVRNSGMANSKESSWFRETLGE
jgi:hypothetical protein